MFKNMRQNLHFSEALAAPFGILVDCERQELDLFSGGRRHLLEPRKVVTGVLAKHDSGKDRQFEPAPQRLAVVLVAGLWAGTRRSPHPSWIDGRREHQKGFVA